MQQFPRVNSATLLSIVIAGAGLFPGCGTTRSSNTIRTATEQLLISDAIDRTVQSINFSVLSGESVYFDESRLNDVVDKAYLISSLRQHLLASGCVLKDARDQATFVVEPRAGAVGTDNYDLLFGVPAIQVPQVAIAPALPAAIPEIPFAKRRDQRGVAKVAVFAYRRETGEPVWQSGIAMNESNANDIWILGAGPFKRGTIYDGARFAGGRVKKDDEEEEAGAAHVARVQDEAVFAGARRPPPAGSSGGQVVQASAETPIVPAESAPGEAGPPVLPPPRPLSEAPRAEDTAG